MSEPVQGLQSISVHIRDIRRAREFYGRVLGLREIAYSEEFSRAAFAIPGTPVVLSMHVMGEGEDGRPAGTVTGVVFEHADPFAACEEIRRRGGTITNEPATVQRPGVTFTLGVFADPDGNEYIVRSPQTWWAPTRPG